MKPAIWIFICALILTGCSTQSGTEERAAVPETVIYTEAFTENMETETGTESELISEPQTAETDWPVILME